MDLFAAIRSRRSVRRFTNQAVPESLYAPLVEALLWAPSAGNLQSRRFVFVTQPLLRRQLAAAAEQEWLAGAPLIVVGCADAEIRDKYRSRGVELYAPQDVALALGTLMLVAHAHGLGSCWVGSFNEAAVARHLGLPRNLRPVALVPLGFPAESPPAPARRPIEALVDFRR